MSLGQFNRFAKRLSPRQPGGDRGGIHASGAVQDNIPDPRRGQHPFALSVAQKVHRAVPGRKVAALDKGRATEGLMDDSRRSPKVPSESEWLSR